MQNRRHRTIHRYQFIREGSTLLADFMDGENVEMTEPAGGLCFSVETLAGLFVLQQMRR